MSGVKIAALVLAASLSLSGCAAQPASKTVAASASPTQTEEGCTTSTFEADKFNALAPTVGAEIDAGVAMNDWSWNGPLWAMWAAQVTESNDLPWPKGIKSKTASDFFDELDKVSKKKYREAISSLFMDVGLSMWGARCLTNDATHGLTMISIMLLNG